MGYVIAVLAAAVWLGCAARAMWMMDQIMPYSYSRWYWPGRRPVAEWLRAIFGGPIALMVIGIVQEGRNR